MHGVAQPGVAWLGHQFVYLATEDPAIFLRVTDRATCATVATLPDPANTLDLIGAHGVGLVRSMTPRVTSFSMGTRPNGHATRNPSCITRSVAVAKLPSGAARLPMVADHNATMGSCRAAETDSRC